MKAGREKRGSEAMWQGREIGMVGEGRGGEGPLGCIRDKRPMTPRESAHCPSSCLLIFCSMTQLLPQPLGQPHSEWGNERSPIWGLPWGQQDRTTPRQGEIRGCPCVVANTVTCFCFAPNPGLKNTSIQASQIWNLQKCEDCSGLGIECECGM